MPTGYTDMIDTNPDMTTKQWVMEGLARAFGICVTLRDDSLDLSEEQIRQRIAKDGEHDVKYHHKELTKAKRQKRELIARTEEGWKTAWTESKAENARENQESISQAKIMKERHTQVLNDLQLVLGSPEASEFTKNVVKFGIQQLGLVVGECQPYIREPISPSAFKTAMFESNARDIKYHTEELAKAKERANERITLYLQLSKDCNTVLHEKT